jgi:hypothetical protein
MARIGIVSVLLRTLTLAYAGLLLVSHAEAQMPPSSSTTSTPISGAGHDYLGEIGESVNPATGSVSIRLNAIVSPGSGLTLPFSFAYDSNGVNYIAMIVRHLRNILSQVVSETFLSELFPYLANCGIHKLNAISADYALSQRLP